jgi:hypothetical protein
MPKPRTEDEIVPGTKEEIGAGIQGAVFKYQLVPPGGGNPSEMILKYDSSGLNENAKGAGIPDLNPQQSVRAVAAYKMSQQLNLGLIPRTEVFVGTDDDDGHPKLGQAMEFVKGTIGQRTVRKTNEYVDQGDMQKAEAIVKNPDMPAPFPFAVAKSMLDTKVKVKDTWYAFELFPTNIDYGNPIVQKGLSDVQVFDYIIGHSDRNAGNWIYEKDDTDSITRVKGIDNDDTFGEDWSQERAPVGGAIRGIPPIVDISTALSILNANFEAIRPLLAGLSDGEINQVSERLDEVKRQVGQRVMAGQIASMGNVDQATLDELHNKVTFIGPRPQPMPGILRWGDQGIAGYHTGRNSYLGFQLAAKNQLVQQYPETGGVVPGSGDVFV